MYLSLSPVPHFYSSLSPPVFPLLVYRPSARIIPKQSQFFSDKGFGFITPGEYCWS